MSPRQRDLFLRSEGDAYHRRNPLPEPERAARAETDEPLRALRELGKVHRRVLEVGAGNGWRLASLREAGLAGAVFGLEPSREALREGSERFVELRGVRGTAERLPFARDAFDLVILGFCLYLVDRDDLFSVAREVDRVVCEGGHVLIFDFLSDRPYRNPYAHAPGGYSHKMDYPGMFTWNPAYRQVLQRELPASGEDDRVAATVLRRSAENAYAEGPS